MNSTFQKYNFDVQRYSAAGFIVRSKPLNGFTATNIGDTVLQINGVLLDPPIPPATVGGSVTFGGNEGEVFTDRIYLLFVLPLGANPLCEIVQKYYIV